ncbi:hypothetical protein Q2T40_01495 [Winogradskyella maritima]|nr:hypothetical protein [Winogradskyella maritima]
MTRPFSLGVEHLLQDQSTRYVGFLNAQITSDFTDYKDLVKIVKNSDFKLSMEPELPVWIERSQNKRPGKL